MTLGPFLKWAGGKTRALPAILPLVPPVINGKYREIFLGGGALFFALVETSPRTLDHGYKLSDVNLELINAYRVVRDQPLELLELLQGHAARNCESFYYSVRAEIRSGAVESAARFIYLNKTCFNGLHRVNAYGGFNVPYGHRKSPRIHDADTILACSRALSGAELECCDFKTALAQAKRGDFVYADPPYLDPSPGAFTAYSGKFSASDANSLSYLVAELQAEGVSALISNADNELTRVAFDSFNQDPVRIFHSLDVRRSVGASAKTRKKAPEILVECPAT